MSRVFHVYAKPLERLKLSLFEKVILANSVMLIFVAIVGLWITSHNLESHHYLIDTSFIVLATLLVSRIRRYEQPFSEAIPAQISCLRGRTKPWLAAEQTTPDRVGKIPGRSAPDASHMTLRRR